MSKHRRCFAVNPCNFLACRQTYPACFDVSSYGRMGLCLHSSKRSKRALTGELHMYASKAGYSAKALTMLSSCSNPELKKSLDQVKERYTESSCMDQVESMPPYTAEPKSSALCPAGHKASLKPWQRLLKWPKMPQVSSRNGQARCEPKLAATCGSFKPSSVTAGKLTNAVCDLQTASSMQDQVRSTAEAYTRSAEQSTQQSTTQQAHSPSTATTQPDSNSTAARSSQQQQQSSETASAGKVSDEMPSQDESSARQGNTSTSGYSRQQSGGSQKGTDAKPEGLMNRLRSVREAIRKEVCVPFVSFVCCLLHLTDCGCCIRTFAQLPEGLNSPCDVITTLPDESAEAAESS